MRMGKQTEIFVLNMNADLAFEHFRLLKAKKLAPQLYAKSEFIKGAPGMLGSVCYQEFDDGQRKYEYRIVGINELKRELVLETLDYKEPTLTWETPLAQKRMVKFKIMEITNQIFEDKDNSVEERCLVKWTTILSSDCSMEQMQSIQAYKKRVISIIQQPFPNYPKIHAEAEAEKAAAQKPAEPERVPE